MESEIEELKKKGNECMKEGKYIEAMLHYTTAIKKSPRNHHLLSNRSLAFLKMDQYFHALDDARSVIKLQPGWAKGYFRKGEVEMKASHYQEAVVSYRQGMVCDPEDSTLRECYAKAGKMHKRQQTEEKNIPIYGSVIGFIVGLLIVIADSIIPSTPTLFILPLQVVVICIITFLGCGISLAYRYIQREQRKGLLDEPIDLFQESDKSAAGDRSSEPTTQTKINSNKKKSSTQSSGKQRFRKGKTS